MKDVRIGLDIAQMVFQVHGVDEPGKSVLKKTLSRGELLNFFANTPASLIGIEACAGHDRAILAARHALYLQAKERNPARWSGSTRDWSHIAEVALNPERDAAVILAANTAHTQQQAA